MGDLVILDDIGEISQDAWADLEALPVALKGSVCVSVFADDDGNEVVEIRVDGVVTKRIETGRPKASIWDLLDGIWPGVRQ